ncbi:MAG: hypothetical protein ACRCVX_12395 [Shewanella sp.]
MLFAFVYLMIGIALCWFRAIDIAVDSLASGVLVSAAKWVAFWPYWVLTGEAP